MAVEKIAEYLAIIGFEEDQAKSLEKILNNARIQVAKFKQELQELYKGVAPPLSEPVQSPLQRTKTNPGDNAMRSLRAAQKQAVQLGKTLAPTQIFNGLEKISILEKGLDAANPEAQQLRKELQDISKLLNVQLAKKKTLEIDVEVAKGLRNLRTGLGSGGKDLTAQLNKEFDKIITQPKKSEARSLEGLQAEKSAGKITSGQFKAMAADIQKQFQVSQRSLSAFASRVTSQSAAIAADIEKVGTAVEGMGADIREAENELASAQGEGNKDRVVRARRTLDTLRAKEKAFNKERERLERHYSNVVGVQSNLQARLRQSSLDKSRLAYRSFFQKIRSFVSSGRNMMNSFAAPLISGLAIFKIANINRRFEATQVALEAGLGSAKEATKQFSFLRQESSRLGLDLIRVAPEFNKIMTSGKLMGLSLEESKEIFVGVSEAASVMQLSSEDSEGAIRALTQMLSKGTVQAEELNFRLAA